MTWQATIGLEIHVQLRTRTKMFCGCELAFGAPPNTRTCPVCLGLPGSLPVVNARAIEFGLVIGRALGCELAPRSIFHRKNYFYPDLPKGYQISQYDEPLCRGGGLGGVRIHRVHLEEDAAKLVHIGASGRIHGADSSVVDFNRGGTPLVEIVTEPDLHDAEQARVWLTLLAETLRQLGVSDVRMEEGSLRCDANVSVARAGSTELGVKTELKNMNSFSFVKRGIEAEIARQQRLLDAGEPVHQQTLHFDPRSGELTALRSKEQAHDYRYFPEPDLVPLAIDEAMVASATAALGELPAARIDRYERDLGLSGEHARQFAFRPALASFFEEALAAGGDIPARDLATWTAHVAAALGERDPAAAALTPAGLSALVVLVRDGAVAAGPARTVVLPRLLAEGGDPARVIEQEGVGALDDSAGLAAAVASAIDANPDAAERIRAGNAKAIGPIIGEVMRATKGRADGGEVTRLVREQLGI